VLLARYDGMRRKRSVANIGVERLVVRCGVAR
jgi:hypothetical protein